MEQVVPTARSKLHGLLRAIVMGREMSRAFMWSAMSLKENKSLQFLNIYMLKHIEKEYKTKTCVPGDYLETLPPERVV